MANHVDEEGIVTTKSSAAALSGSNSSSGPTVSWNETGFESYPPSLDTIRQFLHLSCVGFGFPLNVMVASVIFRQRRLRNPRNTFWLGIIFCNLLALTNAVVEYVAFELLSAQACSIFRVTAGIPYTVIQSFFFELGDLFLVHKSIFSVIETYCRPVRQLLLVNLLLASLDRWVALTYPLFHRDTVTVRLVVLLQLFFCTIVVTLSTLPYWTNLIPLSGCGVHPTVLEWTTIVFFGLTLLSIVAQVQIYCRARSCLRRNLTHHLFNHQTHRINRLELEATITLVCGVVSLCFFSLPYSAVSMGDWICRRRPPMEFRWCSTVQYTVPYARELFLVHSVYNPIMYMIRSREFSEALRSIISCPWGRKQ